ncbi:metal ABC transporter solute-binding protein, Zn/Mn family [Jeotgalibacillus soli]|uniref:Manganese transporter n=1 Tax=Jeotgalibacillus soli TaxID=889306 RepID=A0A0C2VI14_9BACL|nr:zinc ABC transporter substrate-binding protein [Jeotgalibacillus soli]KIL44146.1 manganese transporter [Jeotgalibacillus soli]
MYSKALKRFVSIMVMSFVLVGCNVAEKEGGEDQPIQVVATTSQIGDSISQIGGEFLEVTTLMGPGVDPHIYQPTQRDIQALQNADIVFYNGLHLEGRMDEVFEQIGKDRPVLALADAVSAQDLLNDPDEPAVTDPHIWFDIDIWMTALDHATKELEELLPNNKAELNVQKEAYFSQLEELKTESLKTMATIPDEQRVLVTAHDAFGYFGRMYNTEVLGLQGLSTEDEIGVSDIQEIVNLLVEREIPSVFVESSISERSIRAVIEGATQAGHSVTLGGELYSDAMGAKGTETGTYIGMYKHNIETISQALLKEGE